LTFTSSDLILEVEKESDMTNGRWIEFTSEFCPDPIATWAKGSRRFIKNDEFEKNTGLPTITIGMGWKVVIPEEVFKFVRKVVTTTWEDEDETVS
tara:strand:+ start:379 stop:663 length:285 start_codon:yes stop_codon:yes gene_type:complete